MGKEAPGIEIEIKARIPADRVETLLGTLRSQCSYIRDIYKHDEYYKFSTAEGERHVRIRSDVETYITFKRKTKTAEGLEINGEWETSVGDASIARELLAHLGCTLHYRKRKRGYAFTRGEVLAELCEVNDLGWFLELEYIIDRKDPALIHRAEQTLKGILAELDIPESYIETRFYAEIILGS